MKLKYCGIAYALFERVIRDKFVGEDQSPCARLFCQFHAPQTSKMKKEILSEIKRHNSRIRVIFATTALGMGVNAPYVDNVIHITPPASIEAYMQEFGRAGRKGQNAKAVLFYNNSDIAANKKNVEDDRSKPLAERGGKCSGNEVDIIQIQKYILNFTTRIFFRYRNFRLC